MSIFLTLFTFSFAILFYLFEVALVVTVFLIIRFNSTSSRCSSAHIQFLRSAIFTFCCISMLVIFFTLACLVIDIQFTHPPFHVLFSFNLEQAKELHGLDPTPGPCEWHPKAGYGLELYEMGNCIYMSSLCNSICFLT